MPYTQSEENVILEGLQQEFETFTGVLIPLLPDKVVLGLLADSMNDFLDITSRFTPVSSYVNEKTRSKIQQLLNPPEDFSNLFELNSYQPMASNNYFLTHTKENGKADITLKQMNTAIGYFEVSIMTFGINWNLMETIAGMAASIIKPAKDITANVKDGMDAFLDDPNKTRVQAHTKQVGWTGQLISAQQLLTAITAPLDPEENDGDYTDSAAIIEQANDLFESIQKWLDPDYSGNQGDPHDDAWKTANTYLNNSNTSLIGRNMNSNLKALAAAQSIRLSLLKGMSEDNEIISKIEQFKAKVEAVPEFPEWEEFFNKFFGELNKSDLGAKLAGALQYGSISALLAEAGIPEDLMDLLLGCLGFASVEDYDDLIQKKLQKIQEDIMNALSQALQLPSFPEFKRWQEFKDEMMKMLQDKLKQIEQMIAEIEDPKKLSHFTSYELDVEDPCSIESLFDAIAELIEQLTEETIETIEEIAASLGGNIVAILLMVIADWVTAELAALAEQWMQESIFGNALKALMNQIAMVLLAFEGAQLYMKYLAAIALQNQLLKRKELGQNLIQQYTGLISIVQKMMNLDSQELNAFQEISLSRGYVGKADGALGIELSRVTADPPRQVSKTRITQVNNQLSLAIKALGGYDEAEGIQSAVIMNDLFDEYSLGIEVWFFTQQTLRELAVKIQERFFTVIDGEDYSRFLGYPPV